MKNRNSLSVYIGRIVQKYIHLLSFLDKFSISKKKIESPPIICLLAAPRSGSTLTYQILSDAFENNHLSNFSNLFYSTPIISFKIQSLFLNNIKSNFSSKHGFVSGLFGEAEGKKFWEYWAHQSLLENKNIGTSKLFELHNRLKKLNNKPFITGYLGHPFYINILRKEFDKILFVHLERDMLSHCYSLYNYYGNNKKMKSATPYACLYKTYGSLYERCVDQISQINSIITRNTSFDFIKITYEEICKNPSDVILQIQNKANTLGIDLMIKNEVQPFKISKVGKDFDKHTIILHDLIKKYGS